MLNERSVQTVVIREAPSNPLGTAAFVLSLVSFFSLGALAPISLILSFMAMGKKPQDMAVAGLVLSGVSCLIGLVAFMFFGLPFLALLAAVAGAAAHADKDSNDFYKPEKKPAVVAEAPQLEQKQELGSDGLPLKSTPMMSPALPAAEVTAEITDVKRGNFKNGGASLTFQLKNTSHKSISFLQIRIKVNDRSGKEITSQTVRASCRPIEPGQSRPVEMPIAAGSPLAEEFPPGAKVSAELMFAE